MELHLALASDRAYLPWVATAIRSAVVASQDCSVVVHLLCAADVTPLDRGRLHRMVVGAGGVIAFLDVDESRLGALPAGVLAHGGAISCARFLLPALLPDVDRVVYLDADTLTVLSLSDLASMDLHEATVAAVLNVVEPSMRPRLSALGLRSPLRYFNSGLLVMNLARMRLLGTAEQLLAVMQDRGDELLWVDQDALNLVLEDSWHELDPKWNAQNSFWDWPTWATETFGEAAVRQACAEPGVLHFEGPALCKPWHVLCDHAFVDRYRQELHRTPWAGQPLVDRTVATSLIRMLPSSLRRTAFLRLHHRRSTTN